MCTSSFLRDQYTAAYPGRKKHLSVSCMIHNTMTSRAAERPLKCIWHTLLLSIFHCKRLNYSHWPCSGDRNKEWMDEMMARGRNRACVCEVLQGPPVNILYQCVSLYLLTSRCFVTARSTNQYHRIESWVEGNNYLQFSLTFPLNYFIGLKTFEGHYV